MKIGDRVFVRGYIDEIRKDTVIIRNAGGYFGTIPSEVITGELPSAQPEPCDDPRADIYYLAEKIGIHRLYALVVELRGEPEPCEDAVSRAELLHIFEENCYPVHYDHNSIDVGMTLPGIVEVLNIATSVTPKRKTGKWERIPYSFAGGYRCSCCGQKTIENVWNFCPNCGADMRGKQNDKNN